MPGSSSARAMSSSQQLAGLPASAQPPTVTCALSGSVAPLQPLAATGQQASCGLRRAPSRKRGRAAEQEQQTDSATLAASTETVPAPTSMGGITPAEPASSLPIKGKTINSVEANMSASSEDAVLDSEQAANGNRRNSRRRPQLKTVAPKGDVLPEHVAVKSEVPSDIGMQPVSASPCAGNSEEEGITQARRNSRRTGKALPTVKVEDPAAAMKQEDPAALLKQEDQAAHEYLGSALHVSSKPSDTSVLPSAADAPAADLTNKSQLRRKAQQSKAAVGVSGADQNGDTANSDPAAAPPAAKMSRQKRAKVEKVVAETSAAIAQEAAAQDPAVAQAPVAGLDEHKPRKRSRPAKKAAHPPTDAADGDVSASEAPAAEGQAGLLNVDSTGETAALSQTSKPPRKRASHAKKAAAPDAADGEAGASEAAVAGSDASMSDASVSVEGPAPGSAEAAGKTSKPRKRAPRAKKATASNSAAASSMSEASEASEGLPAVQSLQQHN